MPASPLRWTYPVLAPLVDEPRRPSSASASPDHCAHMPPPWHGCSYRLRSPRSSGLRRRASPRALEHRRYPKPPSTGRLKPTAYSTSSLGLPPFLGCQPRRTPGAQELAPLLLFLPAGGPTSKPTQPTPACGPHASPCHGPPAGRSSPLEACPFHPFSDFQKFLATFGNLPKIHLSS